MEKKRSFSSLFKVVSNWPMYKDWELQQYQASKVLLRNLSIKLSIESKPEVFGLFRQGYLTLVSRLTAGMINVILSRICSLADSLLQQMFIVRFLGSMAVKTDSTTEVIYEAMRQVLAARAIHNIFRMTESHLMVTSQTLRYIWLPFQTLLASFDCSFKAHSPIWKVSATICSIGLCSIVLPLPFLHFHFIRYIKDAP